MSSSRESRSGRSRLGISLATLAVVLGGGELLARLVLGDGFPAPELVEIPMARCVVPDAELGWVGRPNVDALVTGPGFRYRVRTNAQGLRDDAHAFEPAPGIRRVVALGDSMAWGWGVDEGEAWPDVLEASLGEGVEVVNLGIPGYSPDQEWIQLATLGQRYRPDVVVLSLVLNDVEYADRTEAYGLGKPRYVRLAGGGWQFTNRPVVDLAADVRRAAGWIDVLRRRSALVEWASPAAPPREAPELATTPQYDPRTLGGLLDGLSAPNGTVRALLAALRDQCRDLGCELIVVPLPHHHDAYLLSGSRPRPPRAEAGDAGAFRTEFASAVERVCAELAIATRVVDGVLLEAARGGAELDAGDGHPNAAGQRLIGEALVEPVRAALERSGD